MSQKGGKRNGFLGLELEGTSNKKETNALSLPMGFFGAISSRF
jgi:hypothetical protein